MQLQKILKIIGKKFSLNPEALDKLSKILIFLLFGLISLAVLYLISSLTPHLQKTISEIALGLIPEFLGSIAVYWVLDSSIKQLYGISELPALPLEDFVDDISSAKQIRILETFTNLANDKYLYEKFSRAVITALEHGAEIQILLIHPDSEGAKQRHEELKRVGIDVLASSCLTIARFYKLQKQLFDQKVSRRSKLQIKLYNASPAIAMHMCDRHAYVSFFPVGKPSDKAPNLKISIVTTFGRFCASKFDELWTHQETIPVTSHMKLTVILPNGQKNELYYVRSGDNIPQCFYTSCLFGEQLLKYLEESCLAQVNPINVIAEGKNSLATCKKLNSPAEKKNAIALIEKKYEWDTQQRHEKINSDPIIFMLQLSDNPSS
jgi:hypothetical protein